MDGNQRIYFEWPYEFMIVLQFYNTHACRHCTILWYRWHTSITYQCTYTEVQNQKGTTSKTTTLGFVLNIYFISGCCITFYKLHDIYAKELGNQSDIGQVHLRPIVLFSDNSFTWFQWICNALIITVWWMIFLPQWNTSQNVSHQWCTAIILDTIKYASVFHLYE